MNTKHRGLSLLLIASLGSLVMTPVCAGAQSSWRRHDRPDYRYRRHYDRSGVARLVDRVEEDSNAFRHDYESALHDGILRGTERNDELKMRIQRLDESLERLRGGYNRDRDWRENRSLVADVLQNARPVDRVFRQRSRIAPGVRGRWERVRIGLNELANAFGMARLR